MIRLTSPFCALLLFVGMWTSSCSSGKKAHNSSNAARVAERELTAKYSERLGVPPSQLRNDELYRFVDAWEGVPYRYGGTDKRGVDCSGFVGVLYNDVYKQTVPRTTGDLERSSKSVGRRALEEGDLVFFDINGKKSSHVGVYLQNGRFVHASSSKGVIISDLENPYYNKAFSRGGRL